MNPLSVHSLSVRLGGRPTLANVSFEIADGDTVALVGASGSGKTTLLRALLGLLPPDATIGGSILWQGRELAGAGEGEWRKMRGSVIGMIPQEPEAALDPRQTAAGHVRERLPRTAAAEATVAELLSQVSLDPARGAEYPFQWSGGMQQRLLVAMALAQRPRLLLADEPTAALDTLRQQELIELLTALVARGQLPALLVVTHDLAVAARLARSVLVLDRGAIVEQGIAHAIWQHPAHAVTRALAARQPAWPVGAS